MKKKQIKKYLNFIKGIKKKKINWGEVSFIGLCALSFISIASFFITLLLKFNDYNISLWWLVHCMIGFFISVAILEEGNY